MKAWEIRERFGFENLHLVEREPRAPGRGEVRLRLKAMSLNYRDLMVVKGLYNPRQKLPLVPGSDAVGEVVAVGEDVYRFQVGDRACPIFATGWLAGRPTPEISRTALGTPLDGIFREEITLSEQALVKPPSHLSDEEAACLPCAAVTAWRALVTEGRLRPGQTILTQGTGGVSLFALQVGKMLGARVIITSSSDEKLDKARALGADLTLNYKTDPQWGRTVQESSGGGADLVVELGGAGTLDQSLEAVVPGGTIAQIGVLAGVKTEIAVTRLLMRGIRLQGIFVGSRQDFEDLNQALTLHTSRRPVVDRVFSLEALPDALHYLESGQHMGKIVLRA